ncbi:MAG: restriction endonuclease [Actinomadura rubrobrunea]|nr:restriction endonuclease [Actinomadura rubrobrunea]
MRQRPEPYDEDRNKWLIPDWIGRITVPRTSEGWFLALLGGLAVIALLAMLWRLAHVYWYLALPGVALAWWMTDRWYRSRWEAEKARRARLAELSWPIEELDAMTWSEFEIAVRDLLRRDGIAAEHVGKPGDYSGDVVGSDPVLGGTWMVQVKHYGPNTKVGSQEVQRVAGAAGPVYKADLVLVVTTNTFTEPAKDFAALSGMFLIDRPALIDWASRGKHLYEVLGIDPQAHRPAS